MELNPIRDLSLSLEAGQVTAVLGASGSGKSLLAHAILHLLPRNARVSGILRYGGAPLTQARAEALRGREIALLPQGVTWLDPMMRVGPQVCHIDGGPVLPPATPKRGGATRAASELRFTASFGVRLGPFEWPLDAASFGGGGTTGLGRIRRRR